MPLYSSAAKVAAYLQVPTFSTSTSPTLAQVNNMIRRAEEKIERITHGAWRVQRETEEFPASAPFKHYTVGLPYYLKHRNVKTLATGSGDKIEVWNGSSWVDWIA